MHIVYEFEHGRKIGFHLATKYMFLILSYQFIQLLLIWLEGILKSQVSFLILFDFNQYGDTIQYTISCVRVLVILLGIAGTSIFRHQSLWEML